MKEKPTTFELAHLAALAPPLTRPKDAVKRAWEIWELAETEIAEHENRAEFLRNLFHTSNGRNIPIFCDSPAEWLTRLAAFPGDAREVEHALWDEEFSGEEVQKQLFKDKTISKDSRRNLFLALARMAIHYDMDGPLVSGRGRLTYLGNGEFLPPREGFPIHPTNVEAAEEYNRRLRYRSSDKMLIPGVEVRFVDEVTALLAAPKLNAHLVRWVVEVRQKQLALAKSRVIPPSLRKGSQKRATDETIQFKAKHFR